MSVRKGFDKVKRAERTSPKWEDLAGYKAGLLWTCCVTLGHVLPSLSLSFPSVNCLLYPFHHCVLRARKGEERRSDAGPDPAHSRAPYMVISKVNGWLNGWWSDSLQPRTHLAGTVHYAWARATMTFRWFWGPEDAPGLGQAWIWVWGQRQAPIKGLLCAGLPVYGTAWCPCDLHSGPTTTPLLSWVGGCCRLHREMDQWETVLNNSFHSDLLSTYYILRHFG